MRILFVWPICQFSVWDVARGHRAALARLVGEENIRDYYLDRHTAYHRKALPPEASNSVPVLSKYASETVLTEALYFNADIVLVVSGLNFHPIGLWLLNKVKIPAAALLTESPYEDDNQSDFVSACPGMLVFTNERASAGKFGWTYVPHSFDPTLHHPVDPSDPNSNTGPATECDVLMVGTGWSERQQLLEGVNWNGINFKLYGVWPDLNPSSPIYRYHTAAVINNELIAQAYAKAKICINIHRSQGDKEALSLGPRAFEIAACGAFQLSDYRAELDEVFAGSVPTFSGSADLEAKIRYYLDHADERKQLASMAHSRVQDCTFDRRAAKMLETMEKFVHGSRGTVVPFNAAVHPNNSSDLVEEKV